MIRYAEQLHHERSCGGLASCRLCIEAWDDEHSVINRKVDWYFAGLSVLVVIGTGAYLVAQIIRMAAR